MARPIVFQKWDDQIDKFLFLFDYFFEFQFNRRCLQFILSMLLFTYLVNKADVNLVTYFPAFFCDPCCEFYFNTS